MQRNGKATVLTLAALFAVGCAQSDFVRSRHRPRLWKPAEHRAIARAPRTVEPKILPETYFAAARLFEQQGAIGKAINQYRKAIAVNHNYVAAYHRLGVLFSATGRYDEASRVLRQAVAIRPDSAILRNNLGFALMLRQSWTEAEKEFRRATEIQPEFARAHINLGMVLVQQRRGDEALASFQNVLAEPDAYYNLGLLLRGRRRYDEAADAFKQALALDPGFSVASTQLEQIADRLTPAPPVEDMDTSIALEDSPPEAVLADKGIAALAAELGEGEHPETVLIAEVWSEPDVKPRDDRIIPDTGVDKEVPLEVIEPTAELRAQDDPCTEEIAAAVGRLIEEPEEPAETAAAAEPVEALTAPGIALALVADDDRASPGRSGEPVDPVTPFYATRPYGGTQERFDDAQGFEAVAIAASSAQGPVDTPVQVSEARSELPVDPCEDEVSLGQAVTTVAEPITWSEVPEEELEKADTVAGIELITYSTLEEEPGADAPVFVAETWLVIEEDPCEDELFAGAGLVELADLIDAVKAATDTSTAEPPAEQFAAVEAADDGVFLISERWARTADDQRADELLTKDELGRTTDKFETSDIDAFEGRAPAPTTIAVPLPVDRLVLLRVLETQLRLVREEISCWDETIAETAEPGKPVAPADRAVVPMLAPPIDAAVDEPIVGPLFDPSTAKPKVAHLTDTGAGEPTDVPSVTADSAGLATAPPTDVVALEPIAVPAIDVPAIQPKVVQSMEGVVAEAAVTPAIPAVAAEPTAVPPVDPAAKKPAIDPVVDAVASARVLVPIIDLDTEMSLPVPPMDSVYLRMLLDGLPAVLDPMEMWSAGNWPRTPAVAAAVMPAPPQAEQPAPVVRVKDTTADRPFLIYEKWFGVDDDDLGDDDSAPSAAKSAPTVGESIPSVDAFDWDTIFAALDGWLSIIENETRCWEAIEAETQVAAASY